MDRYIDKKIDIQTFNNTYQFHPIELIPSWLPGFSIGWILEDFFII